MIEEMIEHNGGGKAHKLDYDMTLLPTNALIGLARLMTEELPAHGKDNWKKLPLNEEIRHIYSHLMEFIESEKNPCHTKEKLEYHLVRLFARSMFAYSSFLSNTKCDCNDDIVKNETI